MYETLALDLLVFLIQRTLGWWVWHCKPICFDFFWQRGDFELKQIHLSYANTLRTFKFLDFHKIFFLSDVKNLLQTKLARTFHAKAIKQLLVMPQSVSRFHATDGQINYSSHKQLGEFPPFLCSSINIEEF